MKPITDMWMDEKKEEINDKTKREFAAYYRSLKEDHSSDKLSVLPVDEQEIVLDLDKNV